MIKKIVLLVICGIALNSLSFAEDKQDYLLSSDSEEIAASSDNRLSLPQDDLISLGAQELSQSSKEAAVVAGQDEQIKKVTVVDIQGNKTIATSVILSKIKIRVDQDYTPNITREDIKRLYDTGFFSDIKVNLEDFGGGVKVIFLLQEKPTIEKINYSGLKRVSREKVNKVLNSRVGQALDYPKLNQDVKEITSLYEKKGFSNALVSYKVNLSATQDKVEVEFLINEGKKVVIRKIFITGVDNFKVKRILKLMKTKKKGWFSAGILHEDILEEDMERVASFYRNYGFVDVSADKEIERYPAKGDIYINVSVNEGKKYTVGSVVIKGNKIASTEDLTEQIKLIEGEVFTEDLLHNDSAAIQGYYLEKGYIFARIEPNTSLNPDTGKVDINYNIIENELAYVNRIEIRGNIKTRDKIVRRELRLNPGERFDGKKLKRSKERLNNLGFFEEVSFDMADTDEPNKKDLIVEVKEAKTGEFSFGGGYSSVDKLIGFMEIAQKNFDFKNFSTFTGAGQDLRLKAQLGSVSNSFELSFTEPWIFDYPLSFGFDLYNTEHDRESDVGYGYDEQHTGGDLRFGKEISEFTRAGLTYKIERVTIGDVPTDATNDLKSEEGENLVSTLGLSLTRDNRDNVFSPTRGTVLGSSFELAGGPLGGDKDFFRVIGSGLYDMPVFRVGRAKRGEEVKYSVLEFRLRAGIVSEFGNSETVPIYERFYLGGSNSVRGYNERKIGPLDSATDDPLGGESMLLGNIELTYPLMDFIKGALFYDVGNVWAVSSDLGNGGFRAGVGLGVRLKTPIGPIKLDYGIPLNDEPGEDGRSGKFHFSVSRGF